MTDPTHDELVRTWERMDLPDRDPDVDPFKYFGDKGNGDSDS